MVETAISSPRARSGVRVRRTKPRGWKSMKATSGLASLTAWLAKAGGRPSESAGLGLVMAVVPNSTRSH